MTLVTGTVQDLGHAPMDGTLYARPARFLPAGNVVYAPERTPYKIEGGTFSVELAPGPAVLELKVGTHARDEFRVVIPDQETIGLADLIEEVFPWQPEQVSKFVAERELAVQAKTDAETAAGQAATAAGTATTAAQQTGQDRSHVDQVRALLDEAYDESQAGMALPPRLTETALSSTYTPQARVGGLQPTCLVEDEILDMVGNVFVIDRVFGETWGYSTGRLLTTPDHGRSWVDRCAAPTNNTIRGLIGTPDGEVVAFSPDTVYRSSGWGTPGLTWSAKLTRNGLATFNRFSVGASSDGQRIILGQYGPGAGQAWADSRYAHITVDGGLSWQQAWDSDTHSGNAALDSHVHGCGYDEVTGRWFVSEGHSVGAGIWVAEGDGPTWTWTRPEGLRCDDPAIGTGMDAGPTIVMGTDDGMVCGADDVLGGIYGIPRTTRIADLRLNYLWAWRPNRSGTNGFAQRAQRDPETGLVYMVTSSSGPAPVIMAGTAHTADLVWEWPNWQGSSTDFLEGLVIEPGGWIVAYGQHQGIRKSVLGRVGRPTSRSRPDRGGVLGGIALDPTSTALGRESSTGAFIRALAGGAGSSANADGVALGNGARTTAGYGTTTGRASSAANSATGYGAESSASGLRSGAWGRAALGIHQDAHAWGAGVATTATFQHAHGPRHLERSAVATTPATPSVGNVRTFYHQVGFAADGTTPRYELAVKTSKAKTIALATEEGTSKLPAFITTQLPAASLVGPGAIAWDSTRSVAVVSNGTSWLAVTAA